MDVDDPGLLILLRGETMLYSLEDHDKLMAIPYNLYRGGAGYAYFKVPRNLPTAVHRFLVNPPGDLYIDHINGDRLDNRRCNLRVVTNQTNQANRHRLNANNASGIRGVAWLKSRNVWTAQITVDHKKVHLGCFRDISDAAEARRRAEPLYYGESCPT
jgi:hypothetical protein